jgi:predicted amidohydrolase YtcJ
MVQTIYTGGTIVRLSPTGPPTAEALAVDDSGRIAAIGARDEVLDLRRPGTAVVDLAGRTVLPGFVEAHGHPVQVALALAPPAVDVRPFTVPTAPAVLDRIHRALADTAPGTPVLFSGIDPLLQRGLERPTMASLDALAPDHPVVVVANSLHAAYGNRRMFDLAGITETTPDPPGAEYVRHDGRLSGEVRETAAVFALTAPAYAARSSSLTDALRWAYDEYARAGFTTVGELAYDARLGPLLDALAGEDDCPVRVRAYRIGTPELAADRDHRPPPERPPATARFAQVGVKLWADGSPWIGNVATSFPYLDTDATRALGLGPCHHGGMNHAPEDLAHLVDAFDEQGWQVAVHVHGDVAADAVLDAFAGAAGRRSRPDRRLRLEHCGAMRPEQFRRAAALGATASLFVAHLHHWGDVLVDDLFGPDRGARWMAARSALDAGLRISLHNDGTVTPPDPLGSVATAVTRRAGGSGRTLAPEERIGLDAALRAVTTDAAWQLLLDDVGRLEVGAPADLVVLSGDPRAVPAEALGDIAVEGTVLAGRQTAGTPLA